jgi:hypothetical protein
MPRHRLAFKSTTKGLNSVSEGHVLFISSRSGVDLLKDHEPIGLSARLSVGCS